MIFNFKKAVASIRIATKQIKKYYTGNFFDLCILLGGFNYHEEISKTNIKTFDLYPNGNKEVVVTVIQEGDNYPYISEEGIEIYSDNGWDYQVVNLQTLKQMAIEEN